MAFDYSELKGRIKAKFGTQQAFAEAMGLNNTTLSLKINGKSEWTNGEIGTACVLLKIPIKEIPIYFFNLDVPKMEH